MKRIVFYSCVLSFIFILYGGFDSYGQQTKCKVLTPALSGTYTGKCKNGLANGKGIAHGIDKYEGQFNKGLPHGNGIYTWTNGSYYYGKWVEGQKDGQGKMVYINTSVGDSVVEGYWKNDKYVGSKLIIPYTIKRNLGVGRYNFRKLNDTDNSVNFKFLIGGRVNSDIENLSIASDTGDQYSSGYSLGIQSYIIPLEVKISYRTWNPLHSSQSNVIFEFTINEPGRWEVTINN